MKYDNWKIYFKMNVAFQNIKHYNLIGL